MFQLNDYELQSHLANRYLYRIWDKRSQNYLSSTLLLTKDNSKVDYYAITMPSDKVQNYTLEQTVGYTDATDRPIFENDICLLPGNAKATDCYFLVSFAPSKGYYALYGETVESFANVDLDELKVVGNINKDDNLLSKINLIKYYHDYPDKLNINRFLQHQNSFNRILNQFIDNTKRKGNIDKQLAMLSQYQGKLYRLPEVPAAIYASKDYCTVLACVSYPIRGRRRYRAALSKAYPWEVIDTDFAFLLKKHAILSRNHNRMHVKCNQNNPLLDEATTMMIERKLLGIGIAMYYHSLDAYKIKYDYFDDQVIHKLVKEDVQACYQPLKTK